MIAIGSGGTPIIGPLDILLVMPLLTFHPGEQNILIFGHVLAVALAMHVTKTVAYGKLSVLDAPLLGSVPIGEIEYACDREGEVALC